MLLDTDINAKKEIHIEIPSQYSIVVVGGKFNCGKIVILEIHSLQMLADVAAYIKTSIKSIIL